MRAEELNKRYFDWLCQHVCDDGHTERLSYQKLLKCFHETEFTFSLDMDANRTEDGTDLRFRFGRERGLKPETVKRYLDNRPCSALEMMIALAVRCEEHIMSDSGVGDRTGQWFWNMVVNLGLGSMNDANFDQAEADRILVRFLHRQYERDGSGGLFTVRNTPYDLRTVEIWHQAMWYLDEFLRGGH